MTKSQKESDRRKKIKRSNKNLEEYKYKCLYCEQRFKRLCNASVHFRVFHSKENEQDFLWFMLKGDTKPILCEAGCGKAMDAKKYNSNGSRACSFECGTTLRTYTPEKKKEAYEKYRPKAKYLRAQNEIKNREENPENIHKCLFCDFKFNTLKSGIYHLKDWHKDIYNDDTRRKQGWNIVTSGETQEAPFCKCGCGERLDSDVYDRYNHRGTRYCVGHYSYTLENKNSLKPSTKVKGSFVSKLEIRFGEVLSSHFELIPQFFIKGIGRCDFKIKDKNIIIEVNGSYWHCEPNTEFEIPTIPNHHKKIAKDIKKRKWCKENNYHLIEVWESTLSKKKFFSTVFYVVYKVKKLSHSRRNFVNNLMGEFGLIRSCLESEFEKT